MMWLKDVFQETAEKNWCITPWCTTCASMQFRLTIFFYAFKAEATSDWNKFIQAAANTSENLVALTSMSSPPPNAHWNAIYQDWTKTIKTPRMFFEKLSDFEIRTIFNGIVKELVSQESFNEFDDDGLRILMMDAENIQKILPTSETTLDNLLIETPAGDYLERMRQHHNNILREGEERERKYREKQEEKQLRKTKHQERQEELLAIPPKPRSERLSKGNKPVHKFLKHFEGLSDHDRLKKLTAKKIDFSLDWIPNDLVPSLIMVEQFSNDELNTLVQRIDNRKKKWLRLRKNIEAALK